MPRLRAHNLAISLDGYMAGPDQSIDDPLGVGAMRLHDWVFATRSFRRMQGMDGDDGEAGLDDDFIAQGNDGIGATIMGRNMFGPIRGAWGSDDWKGWWGDDPPFHHQVFVLTHHPRPSIPMQGGTTFHFVDSGIEAALERAFDAAEGGDVRLGGGAATVQQYLRAGLIDDIHVAIVPILLGAGERLFDHVGGAPASYECVELVSSAAVTHVRMARVTG